MKAVLLLSLMLLAACAVGVNITGPCQTTVLKKDTTVTDTVAVVIVSEERCPK